MRRIAISSDLVLRCRPALPVRNRKGRFKARGDSLRSAPLARTDQRIVRHNRLCISSLPNTSASRA